MVISIAQAQAFFLALTRVLAVTIHVPVFGGHLIPNPVKIGLGFLLTLTLIPWQILPPEAASLPTLAFGMAIGRELLIGTIAGFAAALTFGALQVAGEMMGLSSGFSSARLINPALDSSGSAIDHFFMMVATMFFLVMDGHHLVLIALQRGFEIVPIAAPLPSFSMERLIVLFAQLVGVGIRLSLPVLGALLLTDLTLGLLARVAPQMNVFFLGLPVKIAVGLIALGLSLPFLFPLLHELFEALLPRTLGLIGE
jgi:flagellar biosynthesis protein FliR